MQGGGLRDSFLVDGVAFKKTFSYAGFEMQPRSFTDPPILLLNIELELKAEKENAEVRSPPPGVRPSLHFAKHGEQEPASRIFGPVAQGGPSFRSLSLHDATIDAWEILGRPTRLCWSFRFYRAVLYGKQSR